MQETYLNIDDELIYIRHSALVKDRKSLLFIHGLGDSGLAFEDVFKYKLLEDFNIIIPDLVGYGKSSRSPKDGDYSFESHLARIWNMIKHYDLHKLTVIGHSMGGDMGTLLCRSDEDGIIHKFVNIEGALTQYDLFISSKAAKAAE